MANTYSNLDPVITLSNLAPSGSGFSGATQQSLGGQAGYAGSPFGGTGGPSLQELLAFFSQQNGESAGPGTGGDILQSLTQGSFGQQGGFGGGSIGQSYTAGNMSGGGTSGTGGQGYTAGQGSGNTVDPLSIAAKVLGVAKAGVGLASPTQVGGWEMSPETRAAFEQQRAGERTASPTMLSPFQIPADILSGASGGSFAPNVGDFSQLSPQQVQDLLQEQDGVSLYTGAGPGAGIGAVNTLAQGTGGGLTGATPIASPEINVGGAIQGGLGSTIGLLNLIQAIQGNGDPRLGISGGIQAAGALSDLLGSLGLTPSSSGGLGGLAESLFGSAGAAGSLSGGIGNIAGALGLLGGLTENQDISKAAGAIGGIPAAATIASAIPALAGSALGPSLAALQANPYTAAIAAAVMQVMDLYNSLEQGYSGEHTFLKGLVAPIPIVGSLAGPAIDQIFLPSEKYLTFPQRVGETANLEGRALGSLIQGLPYVQSQQELVGALDAFKNAVGLRVGGFGEGSDPYAIPALPEIGARTHGIRTTPTDFASTVSEVQRAVNALRGVLPETYAAPAGDVPDVRNFLQFLERSQQPGSIARQQYFTGNPAELEAYQQYPEMFASANRQYFLDPSMDPSAEGRQVLYGQPGYDYAAAGFPAPGQTMGSVSPYWQALMNPMNRQAAPQAAPQFAPADAQMLQALLAAGNAPGASTNPLAPSAQFGAAGSEETLMDLLRRLSPGAAYAGV